VYAEITRPPQRLGNEYQFDIPALRELIRAAMGSSGHREGRDWRFEQLPSDHPLYHCFYSLHSLPRGYWDWTYGYHAQAFTTPDYLEGIVLGEQLVGVYAQRALAVLWAGEAEKLREYDESCNLINGRFMTGCEELPAYDLGVNIVVYALTREGSLAQKLVAAE
jgi:hypothetical protein